MSWYPKFRNVFSKPFSSDWVKLNHGHDWKQVLLSTEYDCRYNVHPTWLHLRNQADELYRSLDKCLKFVQVYDIGEMITTYEASKIAGISPKTLIKNAKNGKYKVRYRNPIHCYDSYYFDKFDIQNCEQINQLKLRRLRSQAKAIQQIVNNEIVKGIIE